VAEPNAVMPSRKPVDPVNIARGVLVDERDGVIDLAIAGTDYRLELVVGSPLNARANDMIDRRIRGVIRALGESRDPSSRSTTTPTRSRCRPTTRSRSSARPTASSTRPTSRSASS
jgi:hypothetical protein